MLCYIILWVSDFAFPGFKERKNKIKKKKDGKSLSLAMSDLHKKNFFLC